MVIWIHQRKGVRIYINRDLACELIGLKCNTQNPRIGYGHPELDGERISYAEADRWLAAADNVWFNCQTQKFESKNENIKTEVIIDALVERYAA